jgi:predicted lipoprotein
MEKYWIVNLVEHHDTKKKRVQLLCKAVSPTDAEARSTEIYTEATFAWEILSIVGTRIEAVLEGDR